MPTTILDLSPERAADGGETGDALLLDHLRAGYEQAYEELLTRFQQPVFALHR